MLGVHHCAHRGSGEVNPMNTIHKYPLPSKLGEVVTVEMPSHSEILDAQMQHGRVMLWAFVCTELPLAIRHFVVVGTGHDLSEHMAQGELRHISTMQEGPYVWHVFEVRKP
jgi:hypothetical protein